MACTEIFIWCMTDPKKTMNSLIFATHNKNKVSEIASILNGKFDVLSLSQIGLDEEIEEPFDTIRENAIQKAKVTFDKTGMNCFSEDTGLEVTALNGEPGVHSARYAGNHRDFEANIDKLLHNLEGKSDRQARFITIICLILNGKQHLFEGECKGVIIAERIGAKGFGYDSVFKPLGSNRTFGEMDIEEKNKYSHRRKAMDKLTDFLQKSKF